MKRLLKIFLSLVIIMMMIILCGCSSDKIFNLDKKANLKEKSNKEEISDKKEYIKMKGEMYSRELFEKDGDLSYENSLLDNDMIYYDETRLYYKIISNVEEYNIYKERIELPKMEDNDFKENFLLILSNENLRNEDEIDLEISDVIINNDTMHIIMKQKENPDYDSETNIFWAVVDNSMLKNEVAVEIEHKVD